MTVFHNLCRDYHEITALFFLFYIFSLFFSVFLFFSFLLFLIIFLFFYKFFFSFFSFFYPFSPFSPFFYDVFFFSLFDPIPGLEERFTCSQFCAYVAFSFSLCMMCISCLSVRVAQRAYSLSFGRAQLTVHAQLMHACWFTAAFRLTFHSAIVRKKIIASW